MHASSSPTVLSINVKYPDSCSSIGSAYPVRTSSIDQFFADSLNISEASRNLYIHRNTLVYRLDKLEKTLGLNIRNFDDAMTLKIALMVDTYMNYIEKNHDR